jgi:hypothetical protein
MVKITHATTREYGIIINNDFYRKKTSDINLHNQPFPIQKTY